MNSPLALLVAAALASSAAAQTVVDADAALRAAVSQAKTAAAALRVVKAAPASAVKPASSCADAKELETSFDLTLNGRDYRYTYAGCREEERNDYLPPYTERGYRGPDGTGMTIVTNEGEDASQVLLSDGGLWVGDFARVSNASLTSGDSVALPAEGFMGALKTKTTVASLRDASKPLYLQLKTCEAADWSKEATSAPVRSGGKPEMGWNRGGPSLVLLTKTAAYYYHEDCDICAEITKCELASGALSSVERGHSADCADLTKFRSEPGVVYDSCVPGIR